MPHADSGKNGFAVGYSRLFFEESNRQSSCSNPWRPCGYAYSSVFPLVTQFILKREPEANKNLNSNRFFINELMYAIVLISFIALVRY